MSALPPLAGITREHMEGSKEGTRDREDRGDTANALCWRSGGHSLLAGG